MKVQGLRGVNKRTSVLPGSDCKLLGRTGIMKVARGG